MKLKHFISCLKSANLWEEGDPEVEFVGVKWQDQYHPSAELYPVDFVDAKLTGKKKVTVKFITTKHNP